MRQVRRLIEAELPDDGLLREKTWRSLKPLIEIEMQPYADGLRQSVYEQEYKASPLMQAYAEREAKYAGAAVRFNVGAPIQASVIAQVDRAKIGKQRFRDLFMPKQGPIAPWVDGMFRVVDRRVKQGILQGLPTEQIAKGVIAETIIGGVPGVSLRGDTSVRQIRAQALAMTRTVTQDVQKQVKRETWRANAAAFDGLIYQWSSALDSKVCPTCAPLDGQTWTSEAEAPEEPLHPNCRCQLLIIDPEDEFWTEPDDKTGIQLSEKPFSANSSGTYKTKTTGKSRVQLATGGSKAKTFYRQARRFTGTDFADWLESSNQLTQVEFFGGGGFPSASQPRGGVGYRRMQFFRKELKRMNKDPQQILESMLTGPTLSRKFIPLP